MWLSGEGREPCPLLRAALQSLGGCNVWGSPALWGPLTVQTVSPHPAALLEVTAEAGLANSCFLVVLVVSW